jgi:hypothetical protein
MPRSRITALVFTVALAAAALAPVAQASAAQPRLVGTPVVTYSLASSAYGGRFVSIGATFRLDRPFANAAEQRRFTIVAAPRLRRGQVLPDTLFGGTALGRVRGRAGAWYRAEAVQLRQRSRVARGARWRVALARGNRIVGAVKTVRLRRARSA